MPTPVNPDDIGPPAANYVHAMLSDAGSRFLHTSGVVPVRPDGTVPDDIGAQAAVVWDNICAMLRDADMTTDDIVSVTTYVVPGEDLGEVMARRDETLGNHRAASTLVIVPMLAQAAWKMEIAIVASQPPTPFEPRPSTGFQLR